MSRVMVEANVSVKCLAIVFFVGILGMWPTAIRADSGTWSEPELLSGTLTTPSQFPKIASSSEGRLHVIWTENSYASDGTPDAIYYSRFDGTNWTPPVDVLVSPLIPQIAIGELVVLPDDHLALLWMGGQQLFFSVAPAAFAHNPSTWQTTPLLPGLSTRYAFMLLHPPTTLYIVAIDAPNFGLKFIKSDDLGDSWTEAREIWSPITDGYAAEDPRLCQNSSGMILHLVWHENARELGWKTDKTWHMRSLDAGATWTDQFSLPLQGSSPNCAYDGDGRLHLLWNNAVGSKDGRYHLWSLDDGATWSAPTPIFPGLSGRTRAPAFGLDSNGILHVLTGAYSDGKTPMYWSYWEGQSWTTPRPISGDLSGNESPDLIVTEGNRLNAVWHFDVDGFTKVVFSMLQTSAPAMPNAAAPAQPLQTLSTTSTPEPDAATSNEQLNTQQTQEPETLPTPHRQDLGSSTGQPGLSSAVPIIIGAISALVIVLGALATNVRRR